MNFKCKIFVLNLTMMLLMSNTSYATEGTNFSTGKAILELVFYIIIFVLVIVITIYGTKFIAKNSRRFINSKYMRVIDTLNLGTNIKITMVEINKTIYVFAITNNTIEVVDKLPEKEFENDLDFEHELDRYKDKYTQENHYFNRFQSKISRMLIRSNKFIDKEDEDNEKKC